MLEEYSPEVGDVEYREHATEGDVDLSNVACIGLQSNGLVLRRDQRREVTEEELLTLSMSNIGNRFGSDSHPLLVRIASELVVIVNRKVRDPDQLLNRQTPTCRIGHAEACDL